MSTVLLASCRTAPHTASPQYRDGGFRNPLAAKRASWRQLPKMLWRFAFDKPAEATPATPVPVQPLTRAQLLAAPDRSLFRLGHSTVLFKLDGEFWLTDPVFSERASPVQWAGPRRFHDAPIGIDELPPIKAVILSHDHYDHLDQAAVRALADKTEHFLAPLGVGDLLVEWGVDAAKVRQLDWWQDTRVAGLRFVATPAQHFSGRGLFADNPTLWASWVILHEEAGGDGVRLFFSGDSGYFDGFREIGKRYGPFDLALVECGGYNAMWSGVHMQPEETLQAHLDLRADWLLPVHNGTFALAPHDWHEPLARIHALAEAHGVRLTTPGFGEAVALHDPPPAVAWWQDLGRE